MKNEKIIIDGKAITVAEIQAEYDMIINAPLKDETKPFTICQPKIDLNFTPNNRRGRRKAAKLKKKRGK